MPSNSLPESAIRRRIARKTKIKIAIIAVVVAILVGYLVFDIVFQGPLASLLMNQDKLVTYIQSLGAFGPLLYILLQITQTVFAPIPGQVVGSVGGFLFGTWGVLWTTTGSLIGCWIVFVLARRFGRPLLEKIFKKSVIKKFDFILESKGTALVLFAIFLLPGFPDDLVCYMAGLTKLPIPQLMLLVGLGRLPTVILTNYIGAGLTNNIGIVIAASVIGIAALGLVVWQRERIIKFLKGEGNSLKDNDEREQKDK